MADEIKAGVELDVQVLRALFGVKRVYCRYGQPWTPDMETPTDRAFYIPSGKPWRTHSIDAVPAPRFSTDIDAAWAVVERLTQMRYSVRLMTMAEHYNVAHVKLSVMSFGECQAKANTMPEAICRVALAALTERPAVGAVDGGGS